MQEQPAYPLLALLRRRLARFHAADIAARVASADAAIAALPAVRRPGCRAAVHSHWVFPIRTPEPDRLMARLWDAGLEATRGASSLHVVQPPPGRPELAAPKAAMAIREMLYLPAYPGVPARSLARLARETAVFTHNDYGTLAQQPTQ